MFAIYVEYGGKDANFGYPAHDDVRPDQVETGIAAYLRDMLSDGSGITKLTIERVQP